jgi:RND family efflux transporter MFP subunit
MTDDNRSSQLASLKINRSDAPEDGARSGRGRTPYVIGAVAAAIVLAGLVLWLGAGRGGSGTPPAATAAEPAASAAPANVNPPATTGPGNLIASGYVVARRRATVAAEVTGRVAEVLVEEGVVVKEGQLLARLDDTLASTDYSTATSRVESSTASVSATAAELADAERIQRRTQELAKARLVSDADVTKADTQVLDLAAQLTRAKAELTAARSDAKHAHEMLGKTRIVAPFAGVVVDKNAQPGEIISPMSAGGGFTRTGICTIVDMDSLEIEVDVNEAYISRVSAGQAVKATLDAYPDWTIPARVIAIVPTANREKATVRVRIAILSKDPRILPDMAIKVSFSAGPAA